MSAKERLHRSDAEDDEKNSIGRTPLTLANLLVEGRGFELRIETPGKENHGHIEDRKKDKILKRDKKMFPKR
jgi:hypothetical protein